MNTTKCFTYVWQFFNIIHEMVKCVTVKLGNLSGDGTGIDAKYNKIMFLLIYQEKYLLKRCR